MGFSTRPVCPAELSDIDFDSANSKGPAIVTAQPYEESPLQFRFLTGENALLGRKMLRDLGAALGPKHGAVVVDRLISDFYEASLQHLTSFGEFQEAFLHQWIGSIVVAKEVGDAGNVVHTTRRHDLIVSALDRS
eukprot:scaffold333_cov133-Cylindrotheca_fusiformis.AAC.48